MPKKLDPRVKERCVQQMLEHVSQYPNPTAAAEAVASRNRVGTESVRRWYLQAQIDSGHRRGARTEELAEIRDLKAKVRRLDEDNDWIAGGAWPPPGPTCQCASLEERQALVRLAHSQS